MRINIGMTLWTTLRPVLLKSTKDPFNRKGDRGRSGFDIRHNFVADVVYELPFGHGSRLGGWQLSGTASVHSSVPFTPVLAFDNADLQSLVCIGAA